MMRQIRAWSPYLLVVGFGAWCLYCVRADLVQISPVTLVRSWDVVALAALLSLSSYIVRIARWRTYLAQLGHSVGLRFAALTFTAGFAYTLSPAKVGELVRARYYVPLGIPLRAVTAAFFVERLMDLVAMVVLATLLLTASSGYGAAVLAAAVLVLGVLIGLALMPWGPLAAYLATSHRVPDRLRRILVGMASSLDSTRTLLRPRILALGFALGLLAWGIEGSGLTLLCSMFPPLHVHLVTALGIYGVALLLGGLSFLPGGLGSTEAVMTALLCAQGFPVSEALLITLTCRLVTLWLAVLVGWLAVLALNQRPPAVALHWR